MLKNAIKFFLAALAIVIIGVGALLAIRYFEHRKNDDYKLMQALEKLNKAYKEDPYGGDTPEKTLRLFIDALKKGDIDLAAKYFVLDEQEKWKQALEKSKEKKLLNLMIRELESTKLTKKTEEKAFFTLINNNIAEAELVMTRNPLNKRWKITDL